MTFLVIKKFEKCNKTKCTNMASAARLQIIGDGGPHKLAARRGRRSALQWNAHNNVTAQKFKLVYLRISRLLSY